MEFKDMTVEELEARRLAIGEEVEKDGADLDSLEAEIKGIKAELEARKADAAKNAEIRDAVAKGAGKVVEEIPQASITEERKMFKVDSIEYRDAWTKKIIGRELNEEERAALTSAGAVIPTMTVNAVWDKITGPAYLLGKVDVSQFPNYVRFPKATTVNAAAGQAIGTTITANLAALVANTAGKKAARAHLVFNVVGVIITLIVFSPLMNFIAFLTENMTGCSPYAPVDDPLYNRESVPLAISLFHTIFNVGNTIILAFFIPQILKIVDWMVKTKVEDTEDEFRLTYIEGNWLSTAELNLQSAKSEIEEFSKRVLRMYTFLPGLRTAKDDEEFDSLIERITKYEDITDRMEQEITKFLTRVGSGDVSQHASERISTMLRIIDNLESIGDAIFQIAMTRKSKREDAVHFDSSLNANLAHMSELVQKALDVMDANLKDYDNIDLDAAYAAEHDINAYRDLLRAQHLDALKLGIYDYAIGNAYSALYALYEKLGDYIINVSEAIGGKKED